MSEAYQNTLRQAMALSEKERDSLVQILSETVGNQSKGESDEIENAWMKVAERRLKEMKSGTAKTLTWEEFKTKMAER